MRRFLYALMALCWMLPLLVQAAPPTLLPWKPGDELAGWSVRGITRHPEYLRIAFQRESARVRLEIVAASGREGAYCTRFHCVQATRDTEPPEALLAAVHAFLGEMGEAAGQWLPLKPVTPQPGDAAQVAEKDAQRGLGARAAAFWAVFGLAALGLVGLLALVRHLRRRRGETPFLAALARASLWLLALLPAILLTLGAVALGAEILRLSRFQAEPALARARDVLATREGRPLVLTETESGWEFEGAGHEPRIPNDTKPKIYVFGGSSLVVPVPNWAFPASLGHLLFRDFGEVHVINFGIPGHDSFDVRRRVEDALDTAPPDLLILYTGHNDFTNAYRVAFSRTFHIIQRQRALLALALPVYLIGGSKARGLAWEPDTNQFASWLYYAANPWMTLALQRLGLLTLPQAPVPLLDSLVCEAYARNIEEVVTLARQHAVPLLVVTPIGNLDAPVYGMGLEADGLYRRGMAESDPAARLRLLREARDRDALSLDIRAKTPMLEMLRGISAPDVHVLDLEAVFAAQGRRFDYDDFSDYVHLRQDAHDRIAQALYAFIRERELVRRPPAVE